MQPGLPGGCGGGPRLDACIRQLTASPHEQIIRTCAFVIVNRVGVGVVVVGVV
jgi:hypothetical protein